MQGRWCRVDGSRVIGMTRARTGKGKVVTSQAAARSSRVTRRRNKKGGRRDQAKDPQRPGRGSNGSSAERGACTGGAQCQPPAAESCGIAVPPVLVVV